MNIPRHVAERRRQAALKGLPAPKFVVSRTYALKAMSREDVKQFVRTMEDPTRVAIVSIAGVGTNEGHPRFPSGSRILRTRFNDIVAAGEGNPRAVLFTARQAGRILRFVERLPAHIEMLIVHCWGGASRSRAIVSALRRLRGEDDLQEFIDGDPNPHVYRTMLDVAVTRVLHVEALATSRKVDVL